MTRRMLHDLPKGAVFLDGAGDERQVLISASERKHPKAVQAAKVADPDDVMWFGFLGDYEVEVANR